MYRTVGTRGYQQTSVCRKSGTYMKTVPAAALRDLFAFVYASAGARARGWVSGILCILRFRTPVLRQQKNGCASRNHQTMLVLCFFQLRAYYWPKITLFNWHTKWERTETWWTPAERVLVRGRELAQRERTDTDRPRRNRRVCYWVTQ